MRDVGVFHHANKRLQSFAKSIEFKGSKASKASKVSKVSKVPRVDHSLLKRHICKRCRLSSP